MGSEGKRQETDGKETTPLPIAPSLRETVSGAAVSSNRVLGWILYAGPDSGQELVPTTGWAASCCNRASSAEIDCGRFPVKRVVGETVVVEADVLADRDDELGCQVLYRYEREDEWWSSQMEPLGNDRWSGEFRVLKFGRYRYRVEGWIDRFRTWRNDLTKRMSAGYGVHFEFLIGAGLIENAAERATGEDARRLLQWARLLREREDQESRKAAALKEEVAAIVQRYAEGHFASRLEQELAVVVDCEKARFPTWYELFLRSCSSEAGCHSTVRDCKAWPPYIASVGFDGREVLNSNAPLYGDGGQGNIGGLSAVLLPIHGGPFSLNMTVPPAGSVAFRPEVSDAA